MVEQTYSIKRTQEFINKLNRDSYFLVDEISNAESPIKISSVVFCMTPTQRIEQNLKNLWIFYLFPSFIVEMVKIH